MLVSKFGGPVPECLEEAVPGLSWGDCPSPTPGEAGCTWSRRKEGEKVRLQGFPGVLFPGEIMGMKRKEGGGTFSPPLKKKRKHQPSLPPKDPQSSAGPREAPSLFNPSYRGGSRSLEKDRKPQHSLPHAHPQWNCQARVLPGMITS